MKQESLYEKTPDCKSGLISIAGLLRSRWLCHSPVVRSFTSFSKLQILRSQNFHCYLNRSTKKAGLSTGFYNLYSKELFACCSLKIKSI